MTSIELPEEYDGWVEATLPVDIDQDYVRVIIDRFPKGPLDASEYDRRVVHRFVPPKPKPTPPDVKPGGVILWRSKFHHARRMAIRSKFGEWRVFDRASGSPVVFYGSAFADPKAEDHHLLADVDDDGFTVELEGL